MHIPDGFLDTKTIVTTTALSAVGLGIAWRRTNARIPAPRVPLLGVAAAFVFAAQMLNFPVAGGTSGHLMGAVLTAVLLGPGTAVIVITAVLVVQCFLFADGGVLSLGANVFNMAIVGSIGGYSVYRLVFRLIPGERGRIVAVAFSSWCSVVLASLCCAGELSWSGTVFAGAAFPAMAGVHALIGLGEAVMTSLVITAIGKARPELLAPTWINSETKPFREVIVYGLLIAIGLVLFVSPFVSPWPDGLEMVAGRLGFEKKALQSPVVPSMIPGYRFPGVTSTMVSTVLAGTIGTCVVFVLSFLLAKGLLKRTRGRSTTTIPGPSD